MQNRNGKRFAIGVDYGTNSVRAIIVDVDNGAELASHVFNYPSGEAGILLDPKDPNLARQNPADYIEGFFKSVGGALRAAKGKRGFKPENVIGIGVDTTGSTPIPVDRDGTPLAMKKEFRRNLAAQAWLWKDHTSYAEAAEITAAARKSREGYLAVCGGTYSSEWYWSKILHCKRTAPKVFEAAASFVELADFIPAYLTGNCDPATLKRGICAAGHKAMYHERWGGLPVKLLNSIEPDLVRIAQCYATPAVPSDRKAGGLCEAVAAKVGLPAGIAVAVGAFDAHLGAVGAGIKPGRLVKIIGTSTCDILVSPMNRELPDIPGLCGIVPGSVIPGMYGLEAGQSAVGDIFNWFVRHATPEKYTGKGDAHQNLTREAAKLRPGASGLLALDWNNGNRTVLVDQRLTGLIVGTTLYTRPEEVYRALIEATAFGARVIMERFIEYDIQVDRVVNCGGISGKNSLLMQIYADVLNRPLEVTASSQTCAMGAAMAGAVAGGAHPDFASAARAMVRMDQRIYRPDPDAASVYNRIFGLYRRLHDAFGVRGCQAELYSVMKELLDIRDAARQGT